MHDVQINASEDSCHSAITSCLYRRLLDQVAGNAIEIDYLWSSYLCLQYLIAFPPQIWMWLAGHRVTDERSPLIGQTEGSQSTGYY
jgi:hypothetical protein